MIVLAEVMDKEPTALELFIIPLVIGILALLAVRWSRWLALPAFAFALFVGWAFTSEVRDPYVGPAIVHEAGYVYVACAYFAASLPTLLTLLGLRLSKKRGSHPKNA